MNLEQASQNNLKFILEGIGNHLKVANRGLLDPNDYDLNKYDDLKMMYDMIKQKGNLSALEAQAFLDELGEVRKN